MAYSPGDVLLRVSHAGASMQLQRITKVESLKSVLITDFTIRVAGFFRVTVLGFRFRV